MAGPSRTLSGVEPTSDSNLQRGRACVYCRRRKMKCDGRKPICGPCERANRAHECEYADSQGRSTADYLEEDISRIESRIYELEHPREAAVSAVFLYHPYKQPQRRTQMSSIMQVLDSSRPPFPGSVSNADAWWNSPEPPMNMVENLVDTFIPYASDCGFFLDIERFRRDVLLPHPIGHHSRPSPALLATVYLFGITLNDSAAVKAHEKTFLSRALSSLPASLSGIHPRKAIHALQAEILLSNYFYVSGRFLEGRYHTAASVSLAVGTVMLNPSATTLRSPDADAVEEVERMDGCWTTITLDKAWAVAMATYPNLPDSSEMLNMLWPGENTPGTSPSTVSQFLDGTEHQTALMSPKTLVAKAVILWERANSLVVSWKPDTGLSQSADFSSAFALLDARIAELRHKMAFVEQPHSPGMRRTVVVGRGLVHAAMLQLHGAFAQTSLESKEKCLISAKTILELAADPDLLGESTYICPIFATIWAAACEVAFDEIGSLRATRLAWAHDVATATESELVGLLDGALDVMRRFRTWPLLNSYILKIEQAYAAV
ncbi:Zn(2)-C6 fungal-type domain-containing protein [Mycena venus]|uniref:Zn(2)-C6 fungal-type domain-containing protein n=1 Tax=Mycena venus TaxID=2733690 RepID=A0A8H6XU47_9AGAR|nr:Zn(2)-C6 fungal-type domain-containing protein [Mycena venus]